MELDKIVSAVFMVLVAVILIPIITTTLADANITGVTATVLGFTPVFLALAVLYSVLKSAISG